VFCFFFLGEHALTMKNTKNNANKCDRAGSDLVSVFVTQFSPCGLIFRDTSPRVVFFFFVVTVAGGNKQ
jgi:hypothetical protein